MPTETPNAETHQFAIVGDDGSPILSAEEIIEYDWANHRMTVLPGVALDERARARGSVISGVPFSLVADGVVCYRGIFISSYSSHARSKPIINVHPLDVAPRVVQIELGYPTRAFFSCQDPRGDRRPRSALAALGKLRE
jgi:hypothetical protein